MYIVCKIADVNSTVYKFPNSRMKNHVYNEPAYDTLENAFSRGGYVPQ